MANFLKESRRCKSRTICGGAAAVFGCGIALLSLRVSAQERFWLAQGDKPSRAMVNLKLGGAGSPYHFHYGPWSGPRQLVIQTELGFPVTPDRNGYLILPLQFQISPGLSTIMVPIGFQYDIPLPLRGLYLTPRISAGYAAWIAAQDSYYPGALGIYHTGFILPEFGVKYVLRGRMNFGAHLFSLPIFVGTQGVTVQYRALAYLGFNL